MRPRSAELVRILNPDNEPGRLTLIHRFGATRIESSAPRDDPRGARHGPPGPVGLRPDARQYRIDAEGHQDAPLREHPRGGRVRIPASTTRIGSHLGGVHFELTGDDVTECTGGARGLTDLDLARAYHTTVDPRLNYEQALELAMLIGSPRQQTLIFGHYQTTCPLESQNSSEHRRRRVAACPRASGEVLTPDAIAFVNELAERFSQERDEPLARRAALQRQLTRAHCPTSRKRRRRCAKLNGKSARSPRTLLDRRVEITGPPERKMVINALNSGANVFMADFEGFAVPDLGQPDRWPGEPDAGRAAHAHARDTGRQGLPAQRQDRRAVRAAARMAPAGKTLAAWRTSRSPAHSWISASTCTTTLPS